MTTPDELARFFHEHYEALAPKHGYETRKESAKPWSDVPDQNKRLMLAVAEAVIKEYMSPLHSEVSRWEKRVGLLERRLSAVSQAIDPRFDTSRLGET